MEEIKVGEYCRLARNQGIRKIEEIDEEGCWLDDYIADEFGEATLYLYKSKLKDEVENHSENLIYLLEEGDYVNGEIVIDIGEKGLYLGYADDNEHYSRISIDESEIKSIVTKEQFKSVEYKLEE